MALLTEPWADVLEVLHDLQIVQNDEPADIKLKKRNPTGGVSDFKTISSGWVKDRISQGLGVYTEEFQIAEALLTAEEAQQVHAVEHNGTLFRIGAKMPPEQFDRFWRLQIQPIEKV